MIEVGGVQYRTLREELFVNGAKVYEVYVNGVKVYPESDLPSDILFFIDTSGSMSANQAINGVHAALEEHSALIMSAKAYGGFSNDICLPTTSLEEIESAIRSQSFSGSGDDDYPLAALMGLVNSEVAGTYIAVIGDYEFNLSYSDNETLNRLYDSYGITWKFYRV